MSLATWQFFHLAFDEQKPDDWDLDVLTQNARTCLQEHTRTLEERSQGLDQQNRELQQSVIGLNRRVDVLVAEAELADRERAGAVNKLKEVEQLKVTIVHPSKPHLPIRAVRLD